MYVKVVQFSFSVHSFWILVGDVLKFQNAFVAFKVAQGYCCDSNI
jgi:hypothetical protein